MLTKKQMTAKRFDFDGFPIDAQEDVCRQYNGGAAARNEKIFNEADDGAMGGALADALGLPAPPKNTAKTYRKVMGGDYREAGKDYQEANTRAKELKNKKNASTPITTAAKDEVVKSKTVTVKSGTTSRKSKTSKKTTTPAKKSGGKGKGKKVEYAPNAAYRVKVDGKTRNEGYMLTKTRKGQLRNGGPKLDLEKRKLERLQVKALKKGLHPMEDDAVERQAHKVRKMARDNNRDLKFKPAGMPAFSLD